VNAPRVEEQHILPTQPARPGERHVAPRPILSDVLASAYSQPEG